MATKSLNYSSTNQLLSQLLAGPLLLLLIACIIYNTSPIEPVSASSSGAAAAPDALAINENRFANSHELDSYRPNTINSVGAGLLFTEGLTDFQFNLSNPIEANLSKFLSFNGPDLGPARGYKNPLGISVDASKRAWRLLRQRVKSAVGGRIKLTHPIIERILLDAKVSTECKAAFDQVLERAKWLDSWAIKLLNSWSGFPPSGMFDGTFTDLGSYHTCLNVAENSYIEHAHYCSVTFKPVLPDRKSDYELIITKEPEELRNLFQRYANSTGEYGFNSKVEQSREPPLRDVMHDLMDEAHYHHTLYYKFGTCWPIKCSPFDVRRVANFVGRRNFLLNGPVKCYSKFSTDYEEPGSVETSSQLTNDSKPLVKKKLVISFYDKNDGGIYIRKPHFNRAQKVALTILLSVTAFIVSMTLLDLILNRVPSFYLWLKISSSSPSPSSQPNPSSQSSIELKSSRCAGTEAPICLQSSNIIDKRTLLKPGHEISPESVKQTCEKTKRHNTGSQTTAVTNNDAHHHNIIGSSVVGDHRIGTNSRKPAAVRRSEIGSFKGLIDDCSIITNSISFFSVNESQLKSDVVCLNGLRCVTMVWIIMLHTMVYNDWAAFGRVKEIESVITSIVSQPLYNATYLVDTFFLMSGLLSAYTAFKYSNGLASKFSSLGFIVGRWLRLTPQVMLSAILFILLPSISHGPHWYSLTGEYSENCSNNWWINLLHIQSFYKTNRMCNCVTWWISIDFFYHFCALGIILIIFKLGHRIGFLSILTTILSSVTYQGFRHYELALPPNIIPTMPQTGLVWDVMTIDFMWKPYSHAVAYFIGFYSGYIIAMKRKVILKLLTFKRAAIGWTLAVTVFYIHSISIYWWVTGKIGYTRLVSTIYHLVCPFLWTGIFVWIILACHHGYGGSINSFLSARAFIIMGKASYMIYLCHFQLVWYFYGSRNVLLEPSQLFMLYVIIGSIMLSAVYGIFLCIVFEMPWLKIQRKLMRYIK